MEHLKRTFCDGSHGIGPAQGRTGQGKNVNYVRNKTSTDEKRVILAKAGSEPVDCPAFLQDGRFSGPPRRQD